jgi:hypothetical protein
MQASRNTNYNLPIPLDHILCNREKAGGRVDPTIPGTVDHRLVKIRG